MSIRDQILQWAKKKGFEVVDNIGYLISSSDTIDFEVWGNPKKIKVRVCRKYTYIYLPMPTNAPYKYRYQMKIEKGCAYLLRYLFK